MKRIKAGLSATAVVAVAALAGCSSGRTGSTAGSPGSSSAAVSPSSAASSTAASGSGGGVTSSPTSGTGTGTGTGTTASGKCTTRDLSLHVIQGPEDSSTAGSFYVQLTNTSAVTCTLYGYPGVELIGGVGGTPKPLGMKDVWTVKLAMSGGEKTQTLKPTAASAAFVNFSTRDPGASADVPRAAEVQVIPPDQTTALTARIYNVETGYVTPLVTSKTLTVGPMDIDGVPHK